jgi:double-stranded uracil-DNA glycosylase
MASKGVLKKLSPAKMRESCTRSISDLERFRFAGRTKRSFKAKSDFGDTEVKMSLNPLVCSEDSEMQPTFLILGSAPGEESLRQQRYYAHKMNHFWPIMGSLFDVGCRLEQFTSLHYAERVERLLAARVAVWDVCSAFKRKGSSDSVLECTEVNDVCSLLARYPSIQTVGLNGKTAFKLFEKLVVRRGLMPRGVKYVCLPSTSPQHAIKNAVLEKSQKWRLALGVSEVGETPRHL